MPIKKIMSYMMGEIRDEVRLIDILKRAVINIE